MCMSRDTYEKSVSVLGYAILGLLARGAMSGYDLKLRMGESVGYFWSARHSQIYPELARLEAGGMVAHKVIAQKGKPDKKVYEVTAKGVEAVKEWVTEPVKPAPVRDELVLKAYLSHLAGPGEVAGVFRERERWHRERLRKYEEIEAWMHGEWGEALESPGSPEFASYAALRRGIGYEIEYAGWCAWLAGKLEGPG